MKAEVFINFDKKNHAKPYKYIVEYPTIPTKENIAMAISIAMVLSNKKKTKRFNMDRYYNLVLKLLDNHTNIHYDTGSKPDGLKEVYREMDIKNKAEKPHIRPDGKVDIQEWRVGKTFSNKVVIDIDNLDKNNLNDVKTFYEDILNIKFTTIQTGGGYWLISDKTYEDIGEWVFNMCKILQPALNPSELKVYRDGLLALDTENKLATAEDIKHSVYYYGHGDFCVSFVFMSIKRVKACLRISKKNKDEVIKVIV